VSAFEVQPAALVAAAGDLRAVGRAATGVPILALGSGSTGLDLAMDDLARACAGAGRSLEERSSSTARGLQDAAEHLAELERLLIGPCLPRAGPR